MGNARRLGRGLDALLGRLPEGLVAEAPASEHVRPDDPAVLQVSTTSRAFPSPPPSPGPPPTPASPPAEAEDDQEREAAPFHDDEVVGLAFPDVELE